MENITVSGSTSDRFNASYNYNYETPELVTKLSIVFIVVWFCVVVLLKIMTKSTDSLLNSNKYDLILFKKANDQKIPTTKLFE